MITWFDVRFEVIFAKLLPSSSSFLSTLSFTDAELNRIVIDLFDSIGSSAMTMNLTRVEMYGKARRMFPQRAKIEASVHPVLEPTLKLDVRGGQISRRTTTTQKRFNCFVL